MRWFFVFNWSIIWWFVMFFVFSHIIAVVLIVVLKKLIKCILPGFNFQHHIRFGSLHLNHLAINQNILLHPHPHHHHSQLNHPLLLLLIKYHHLSKCHKVVVVLFDPICPIIRVLLIFSYKITFKYCLNTYWRYCGAFYIWLPVYWFNNYLLIRDLLIFSKFLSVKVSLFPGWNYHWHSVWTGLNTCSDTTNHCLWVFFITKREYLFIERSKTTNIGRVGNFSKQLS